MLNANAECCRSISLMWVLRSALRIGSFAAQMKATEFINSSTGTLVSPLLRYTRWQKKHAFFSTLLFMNLVQDVGLLYFLHVWLGYFLLRGGFGHSWERRLRGMRFWQSRRRNKSVVIAVSHHRAFAFVGPRWPSLALRGRWWQLSTFVEGKWSLNAHPKTSKNNSRVMQSVAPLMSNGIR